MTVEANPGVGAGGCRGCVPAASPAIPPGSNADTLAGIRGSSALGSVTS
jgi:hypothetical protein